MHSNNKNNRKHISNTPNWSSIIANVQSGSQDAFDELVDLFLPLIHKTVGRFLWIAPKEDLYQEAYVALYQAAVKFEEARGIAFPGYVEARIRFTLWNYCKRIVRLHSLETVAACNTHDEDEEPEDSFLLIPCPLAESAYLELELLEIFHNLSERERLAVVQLLVERRKPKDLAAECQVSVETVKTWRKRAIQKLRNEWLRIFKA